MKKLLVFREGMCPDSREVDDYLHDSEVIKGDFIDLNPDDERKYTKGRVALYDSTWSVVFKDDHLYDHWHLVGEGTRLYAFDEDTFKATITLLEPYREHLLLTAVLHKNNTITLIYRAGKCMSHLLDIHMPYILDSFNDGAYTYVIPSADVAAAALSDSKAKAAQDTEKDDKSHRPK